MRRLAMWITTVSVAFGAVLCGAAVSSASADDVASATQAESTMASVDAAPLKLRWSEADVVAALRAPEPALSFAPEPTPATIAAQQRFPLGVNQAPAWQFGLAPYLWFAGIDGDFTAGNLSGEMSTDFVDAVEDLDFGYGLRLEAKNGPWGVLIDFTQLKLDDRDTLKGSRVDLDSDMLIGDFNFLLELSQQESFGFEILAGGRYSDVDNDIKIRGGARSSQDADWFDPTIGARIRGTLGDGMGFMVRADYGGFDIGGDDTDTSWQIVSEFLFTSGGFDLGVGYRHLVQEYEEGTGNDRFEWDQEIAGPTVSLTFKF